MEQINGRFDVAFYFYIFSYNTTIEHSERSSANINSSLCLYTGTYILSLYIFLFHLALSFTLIVVFLMDYMYIQFQRQAVGICSYLF